MRIRSWPVSAIVVVLAVPAVVGLLERPARSCAPEQVTAIETALQSAPVSSEPLSDAPSTAATVLERRCGPSQAQAIRKVLGACRPRKDQSVLYLGIGRCLQQAGQTVEAARSYRAYLEQDDKSVSPERAAERRDRVRRWLQEMGETVPPGATLLLRSNLRGATVTHLSEYPYGLTLDRGENHILQPPGRRTLSLSLRGFERVELPVELADGETTPAEVDWRRHVSPQYSILLSHWDDYVKTSLTPAGYLDKKRRPVSVAISFLALAAGATLIGICAGNVGGACDATWKQGVAYGAGALISASGLVGFVSALSMPLETLPPAGLSQGSSFDSPLSTR